MERTATTFLGLGPGAQEPRPLMLDQHRASFTADAAAIFLPTSGIVRPVPSKLPTKQQFMSFKPVQEDGLIKKAHGEVHVPGFQTVVPVGISSEAINSHRASAPMPQGGVLTLQKSFSNKGMQANSFSSFLNLTNKHSFPLPSHPSRGGGGGNSGSPQVNSNNVHLGGYPYGLPVVQVKGHGFVSPPQSPFVPQYPPPATVQQQQRVVGAHGSEAPFNVAYNTRNSSQPLPTSGQLTIFFGGMVNVYENVSLEKVQAIMSMAANGSNITPEHCNATKQVPLVHPGRPKPADPARVRSSEAMLIRHPTPANAAASPYSGLCSPTSAAASPSVDHSASSSNTPDEPKRSKSPAPSENKASVEEDPATEATPMSRAVPMARKASLARFLEKRKERMSNLAPYSPTQKHLPDGSVGGIKAISSFTGAQHSIKATGVSGATKEQPWHPTRTSNGTRIDANFVNTELEI